MRTYTQMRKELSKMDKKERQAFIQQNLKTYNKECFFSEEEKEENDSDDLRTPLVHALNRGDKEIAIALIEGGVDVNKGNLSPLHVVAFSKDENLIDIIDLLVEKGADINKNHESYGTPLLVALRLVYFPHKRFNDRVARKLIESKADVNISNNVGSTPLSQAIYLVQKGKGAVDLVKLLIDSGAKTEVAQTVQTGVLSAVKKSLYELAEEGDYPGKAELLKLLPKPDKKIEAPTPAPAKQPAPIVKPVQAKPEPATQPSQVAQAAKPAAAGVPAKPGSPVETTKPKASPAPAPTKPTVQPGTAKPVQPAVAAPKQAQPAAASKPVQPTAAAPKAGSPVTLLRQQFEQQAKAKAEAEKNKAKTPAGGKPTGRKTPPPG